MTAPIKEAHRYPLVEVQWIDIVSGGTWRDDEEVEELIREARQDLATTWGLLIKETDLDLTVAGSIRPDSDKHCKTKFSDVSVIPRGTVRQIKVLRKAR